MFVASVVAALVWGALSFGAAYPWGYTPLFIACACIGAFGVYAGRAIRPTNRRVVVCLFVLLVAVLAQLVPLPAGMLKAISPATDEFLRGYDLAYASGAPRHPLSVQPQETVVGLASLAAFSLFFVGLLRALTTSRVQRLVGAVIAFGVVLAIFGIVQKALLGDDVYFGMKIYGLWAPGRMAKPYGPFVNRNNFAGWMMMALPLALGVAMAMAERGLQQAEGRWRAFAGWLSSPEGGRLQLMLVAIAVMSASLVLSKSRSGLGGFLIALAIAAIAARRRILIGPLRWVIAVLLLLFALIFMWAGGDILSRLTEHPLQRDIRPRIWSDTLAVIRSFPLVGTGLNTFGTVMLYYQRSHPAQHFNAAHNEYLEVLSEGGLLLALPVLALLVVVALAVRRRFASRTDDAMSYWIRVGAVTGLLAIALQSLVEFSLQMPAVFALFVVLVAIAMHEPRTRSSRSGPRSSHT